MSPVFQYFGVFLAMLTNDIFLNPIKKNLTMERLPPLNALRVFQIAAEQESFKQASEKLHVTQAAISQQIKLLEKFFGEKLFVRLNREVKLTPAAERLLPYVQKAFLLLEEGSKSFQQDPLPHQLKITSVPSFAARWLIPRLGDFQALNPNLTSFVSTSCDLHDFSDDSQDIAIRFSSGGFPGLKEEVICQDYILPLCHPMLLDKVTSLGLELQELPLLIDESPELASVSQAFKELFGQKSSIALQVIDANLLMDAALNGQGIAPIRYSLAFELIQRGQLVCPLNVYWDSPYTYFLVAPDLHFGRPKVAAFAHWLKGQIAIIEEQWSDFSSKTKLRNIS